MSTHDHALLIKNSVIGEFKRFCERNPQKVYTQEQHKKDDRYFKQVQKVLPKLLGGMFKKGVPNWAVAAYSTVEEIKRKDMLMAPVIIRGIPVSMGEVQNVDNDDLGTATLQDTNGDDQIDTFPIIGPVFSKIQKLKREYGVLDFFGLSVLNQAVDPFRYIFIVVDVRVADSPLQLAMATADEIKNTAALLCKIKEDGASAIDWLLNEIRSLLEIRGISPDSLYWEMMRAVVLQALSDYHVKQANGRIHNLFIGPPASGKKLLVTAAKHLNLTFQQAGHKITAAGLVSTAYKNKAKNTYSGTPGLLPRAHRGTLALEDWHAVSNSRRQDIMGHLAQVMEDGTVHDSTSARTSFQALTGIHLDLNKLSDLHPGKFDQVADSHLPTNIISRFDIVFDVPKDSDRQFEVAKDMIDKIDSIGPKKADSEEKLIRQVRLMVAMLREKYSKIDPTEATKKRAKKFIEQLQKKYKPDENNYHRLSMFTTRMTNSMMKIAAANARGHQRSRLVEEDIALAEKYLEHKLSYLDNLFNIENSLDSSPCNSKQLQRRELALSAFEDRPFTAEEYGETTGSSRATAFRDMEGLVKAKVLTKDKHGKYRFTREE